MTNKSWDKKNEGSSSPGFAKPIQRDVYSQAGANASRSERKSKIWNPHAYNMTRNRLTKPRVVVSLGTTQYQGSTDTCGAQPVFPTIPTPNSNKAIAKLLAKWRGSDFNLGVSLGEGRESVRLMADRMISIAQSARALRKGNFGGAVAALAHMSRKQKRDAFKRLNSGDLAGAWLEMQYGWKPLLNDIHNLADLVSKEMKPRRGKIIRASEKETGVILAAGSFPQADCITIKCERRVHVMVRVRNEPSIPERLGLTDPSSILWELTSLSFVADWFLPIGDSLAAIHAKQAMKVSQACTTQIRQDVCQLRVRSGKKYGSWTSQSDAIALFNNVTMERTVSFGVPPAWGATEQTPSRIIEDWDPSLKRLANATALVVSNLRAFKR